MESTNPERRGTARRRCSLMIQLRAPEQGYPNRCETTDISPCGCYVKSLFPLPVGTVVDVGIRTGDTEVQAKGVVKTSDPGLGNGIEFTEMTPSQRLQLEQNLETLPEAEAPEFIP